MNSYVKELFDRLGDFATQCRTARWLGALFHVRVCTNIAQDIAAIETESVQKANTSEQHDREAVKELDAAYEEFLAAVTSSQLPRIKPALSRLKRARALAHASAEADRSISVLLSA